MLGWIAFLGVFYGVLCLLLYLFQARLIFFPQPLSSLNQHRYADSEITFAIAGLKLHGWWIRRPVNPARSLIIYYGGNAEEVSQNMEAFRSHLENAVVMVNYRGYGLSDGSPSEDALFSDALRIFDELTDRHGVDPRQVVLMGRSLGSAVAVHVASRRRTQGVILVTPFDSIVRVAKGHYPLFPVGFLLRHRFEALKLAPSIHIPALVMVAENDSIVPPRHAHRLADAWGGRIEWRTLTRATHNDIHLHPRYWREIGAFCSILN